MKRLLSFILMAVLAVAAQPAAIGQPSVFRFFVISDVHIKHGDPQSAAKLKAALADMRAVAPDADALVINGDLTEGRPEDYRLFRAVMAKHGRGLRVFYAIGNHEYYQAWYDRAGPWNAKSFPNGESERASIERFLALTGERRVYYARSVNGYPFLFLGSEGYRQTSSDIGEGAVLSREQVKWLKRRLAEADRTGRPIFVFLHQPLSLVRVEGERQGDGQRKLAALFARHPQVILFHGHTHRSLKQSGALVKDGYVTVNSSSVRWPWAADESGKGWPQSAHESEGLYVEVHPDRVVVKGRDFFRRAWIPQAEFVLCRDAR